MSDKVVYAVLYHGEHSEPYPVTMQSTLDQLKVFACKQWRSFCPEKISLSYNDNGYKIPVLGDISLQGLVAITLTSNNEVFYLHVDISEASSSKSRSVDRSYKSSSAGQSSNSCVTTTSPITPTFDKVVDNDIDQAKPLVSDEWVHLFDNIGKEFVGGVVSVRIAVQKYCLVTGYKVNIMKNDTLRFTARCAQDGCTWRIHFVPINGDKNRFFLKDGNLLHRLIFFSYSYFFISEQIGAQLFIL